MTFFRTNECWKEKNGERINRKHAWTYLSKYTMNNTKTLLAQLFHHFPHRDFNYYNTTTLFTPDSAQYQQALMFNAVYLIFTTIVLVSIFAIYFMVCSCYFCGNCSQGALKPRPSRSRLYRLIIALLAGMSR